VKEAITFHKYALPIFTLICVLIWLSGCSYNWSGAKKGDWVLVTDGFYEGKTGVAEGYHEWLTPCQYKIDVKFYDERHPYSAFISSCDLRVINDLKKRGIYE
jgi:hypothetical protein